MPKWEKQAILLGIAFFLCLGTMLFRSADLSTGFDHNPCAVAAAMPEQPVPGAGGTATDAKPEPKQVLAIVSPPEDRRFVFRAPICLRVSGLPGLTIDKDHPLILFLNGEPMTSLVGRIVDPARQLVLFWLDRTADDAGAWAKLTGAPPILGEKSGLISMLVSVGTTAEGPWPRAAASKAADLAIDFLVFDPIALAFGAGAIAAALGVVVLLGANTGLLRDGDRYSTFSLARCQMTWWLFLITAGFLYIWLTTGQFTGVLSPQSLVLLGISGTTGLAAIAITPKPVPKAQPGAPEAGEVVEDVENLPLPAEQGKPAGTQERTAKRGQFFFDLLQSEINGVESIQLHRIQILIWTIILGVVFVWEIYSSYQMPKFDTNLLIMMGISGSLYLGFKFQENDANQATPPAP